MTVRRIIVDHVLLVVADLNASRRLYTAALAPLGLSALHVAEDGVHCGAVVLDDFAIYHGSAVTSSAHVAFDAYGPETVNAFYRAALANCATARGEPRVWPEYSQQYYASFVNDVHGNNVEAVWHAAEAIEDAPIRRSEP